jgi:alkaline phosphatase D
VGSCARTGSNHPVFDDIRESRPLFYLMLGDLSYADVVYDNPDLYRLMFRNVLERSRQKDLYRNVPIVYMWDDHDYGQQGRQGTRARISSARLTYQEYVPHYPLARGRGNVPIYQSFSVGRSFFIVTDLRSERSSEFLTDGPSKSMMGSTQKAWFKEQLLGAAAEYPVIFWACTVPWLVQKKEYADSWGGYTDERTEIANFIRDHELAGRLIILGGDAHMVALDDGTNSDFATGGGAPVPVFHAGAVHQSGSRKGGPYSHGRFTNRTSGVQCDGQFGLVTVTDDAGDAVNVRIRGMRREHDTDELVQLIEWQRTYSASGGTTMRTEPLQSAARIKATP